MGFGYLNDIFGKTRKERKTKYTEVEREAKEVLTLMQQGKMSYDEFFERFKKVLAEFLKLTEDGFTEDTPLWINMFGANVFNRWQGWHMLRLSHTAYPEKFNTPELETRYQEIAAMNFDKWLMEKIAYCLDELNDGKTYAIPTMHCVK